MKQLLLFNFVSTLIYDCIMAKPNTDTCRIWVTSKLGGKQALPLFVYVKLANQSKSPWKVDTESSWVTFSYTKGHHFSTTRYFAPLLSLVDQLTVALEQIEGEAPTLLRFSKSSHGKQTHLLIAENDADFLWMKEIPAESEPKLAILAAEESLYSEALTSYLTENLHNLRCEVDSPALNASFVKAILQTSLESQIEVGREYFKLMSLAGSPTAHGQTPRPRKKRTPVRKLPLIDLSKEETWSTIKQEFYDNAKLAVATLVESSKKETELTFWVHVDHMPIHIYTKELCDGDGAGEFELPTLKKEYQQSPRSLEYEELEEKLYHYLGKAITELYKDGCFVPLVQNKLDIYFSTVDSDPKLICTVS